MPELTSLLAFVCLAAVLVYLILQVPLASEVEGSVIDLRDRWSRVSRDRAGTTFMARLMFIDAGQRTVTIDGVAVGSCEPFALEVGRPVGWTTEDVDLQLALWAVDDTIVEIRLHDDLRGQRAWVSSGDAAMDLPLAGVLGVPIFVR